MRKITITAEDVSTTATLKDNPTADAIWEALPIEAPGNTWGDEIYFGIPVHLEGSEDANDLVEVGDLGYWPPGNAFCIFFGRTPASRGDEPRAASPVNPVGRIDGDATIFKRVSGGTTVKLDKAET